MKSKRAAILVLLLGIITNAGKARCQTADPHTSFHGINISGSVLARVEAWNWFEGEERAIYPFGLSQLRLNLWQQRSRFDWMLSIEQPALYGLPADAVASNGTPLGMGAIYFAGSGGDRNVAGLFPRQAYISLKGFGANGSYLRLGRTTFNEGEEITPDNETLKLVKHNHLSRRLVADAGSTGIGRSFDGLHLSYDFNHQTNVTFLAARPTAGVYDVHGLRDLDISVFYAAFTREIPARRTSHEIRGFAIGYRDVRNVLKVDNRPLALRQADHERIFVGTFGGSYLFTFGLPIGQLDVTFWGALQRGDWGKLAQRAESATVEAGWQLPLRWSWKPWLRSGIWYASGDHRADDNIHGTFFQMLPSQRWYARLPFYALQNAQDYYGEILLRPPGRLQIRSQIHKVKLDDHVDLWYNGSGAFQPSTFGYIGIPSLAKAGRAGGLANYVDTAIEIQASSHLRVSGYLGAFTGKGVLTAHSPGHKGGMAFAEAEYRF
jgi:hypothetical protein